MAKACELSKDYSPPFCVHAKQQTQGYGRHQRPWHSEAGNLCATLALKPMAPLKQWYELSFVTAIAVYKTVAYLGPHLQLSLKWPNDVLVMNKKIAGILIETSPSVAYIGIGLNCALSPLSTSTCLKEWNITVPLNQILDHLLIFFDIIYKVWEKKGFNDIMTLWREMGPAYLSPMSFKYKDQVFEGTFHHINSEGVLYLKTKEGLMAFRTGDVL